MTSTENIDVAPSKGIVPSAIVLFYCLSFVSGMAALIYEITWAKMLSLTFGSTTLAAAAVIAGFMGGMGLGAKLYHYVYDRFNKPIVIYALLEFGIAISTAVLSRIFPAMPEWYAEFSNSIASGTSLAVFRFASVFVMLLLPAALMGATFPALCTVMIHSAKGVDKHLGLIYGINTIGAAAGALIGGLFLIEMLGLIASVNVANGLNIAVGLAALALLGGEFSISRAKVAANEATLIPTFLPRYITGMVLILSGFTTLAYEILWFRAARYFVGNATYALTTVLVVFLIGLGLGSLLLKRVVTRGSPERSLAVTQCLIGISAMIAMAVEWYVLSSENMRDQISIFSLNFRLKPWGIRLLIDSGVAALIMLIPTLLMGLSFPLASRMYLGDVKKLGTRIGGAYLLANIGSILGSVIGAVLLLPLFGTIGGTKVLAAMNMVLGIFLLVFILMKDHSGKVEKEAESGLRIAPMLATFGAVLVVGLAIVLPATHPLRGEQLGKVEAIVAWEDTTEIFKEEGDLSTVQVFHEKNDKSKMGMAIDGSLIAWSDGYRRSRMYEKQAVLAHLPMLLDTRIKTTLNIGLGGTPTLETLASYQQIETLDCVEINQAVVNGSIYFRESYVLDDPRVNVTVDDAVHYLLTSNRKYDLIISDGKQHPFFSGNAPLLCEEFYNFSIDAMSDDGLFVQWINLQTLHDDFVIILSTMCEVFEHVEAFYLPEVNVILVGSNKPLPGRPRMSEKEYANSRAYQDMADYYFLNNTSALISHQIAGKHQILQTIGGSERISNWNQLILDFTPYKASADEFNTARLYNLSLLISAAKKARPTNDKKVPLLDERYRISTSLLHLAYIAYFDYRQQQKLKNLPRSWDLLVQSVQFITGAKNANPDDKMIQALDRFLFRDVQKMLEDKKALNETGG